MSKKRLKIIGSDSDGSLSDYDPKKDTRPYVVYRNDLKHKNRNFIDPSRAEFYHDEIYGNQDNSTSGIRDVMENIDTDSIDYRVDECIREKYQVLDLSHMSKDVFNQLFAHREFSIIAKRLEVLTANDSHIDELPDLTCFKNLICLDLASNKLQSLPNLPDSLEELIVDDNQIAHIKCPPNIKRIKTCRNRIKRIKYSRTLESLSVSDNSNFKRLEELPNLYYLEIARTSVTNVPIYTNLKFLDMDETQIVSLPPLISLHVLSCVKSELSDISNLTNLYSLISEGSKIRQVHYMPTLQSFSYGDDYKNDLKISRQYKIYKIFKNKNNTHTMELKKELMPVKILK